MGACGSVARSSKHLIHSWDQFKPPTAAVAALATATVITAATATAAIDR